MILVSSVEVRTINAVLETHYKHADCLVAGDLNSDDVLFPHLLDCWEAVGEGDGFTYDPTTNELAAVVGCHREARRLDRILVGGKNWHPSLVRLCGRRPFATGLYISDHYGVFAEFQLATATCICTES